MSSVYAQTHKKTNSNPRGVEPIRYHYHRILRISPYWEVHEFVVLLYDIEPLYGCFRAKSVVIWGIVKYYCELFCAEFCIFARKMREQEKIVCLLQLFTFLANSLSNKSL